MDFKKKWPEAFFNTKLRLVSYENDDKWTPTLAEFKEHCFEYNSHLYKNMSIDEVNARINEEHKGQIEYSKKFLELCKPGEIVYTRRKISNPHRLFVTKDSNKDFSLAGFDYEFVLVSVRKLPLLIESRIECAIYAGFENPIGTRRQRHIGTFLVTDLNERKIIFSQQKSNRNSIRASFEIV